MFSISTMLAQFPLQRSMTEGAPSRRMVVKGLLAVVAAGVPATGVGLDAVARRRKRSPAAQEGQGRLGADAVVL